MHNEDRCSVVNRIHYRCLDMKAFASSDAYNFIPFISMAPGPSTKPSQLGLVRPKVLDEKLVVVSDHITR